MPRVDTYLVRFFFLIPLAWAFCVLLWAQVFFCCGVDWIVIKTRRDHKNDKLWDIDISEFRIVEMNADAIRNTGVIWGSWRQSALKSASAPRWLMIREAEIFHKGDAWHAWHSITCDQRPTTWTPRTINLPPLYAIAGTLDYILHCINTVAEYRMQATSTAGRVRYISQIHTSKHSWSNWYPSRGRCTSWSSYLHHLDFLFPIVVVVGNQKVDDGRPMMDQSRFTAHRFTWPCWKHIDSRVKLCVECAVTSTTEESQ